MLRVRSLYQARRALTTAVPRKKKPFAHVYETPDQILRREDVLKLLQNGNISATDKLDNENDGNKMTKIALLAHLSKLYSEPVPSNALENMQTATDIANWFSHQLKPIGALPHTRNLIHGTLLDENATEEDVKALEDRIALEREDVQTELMDKLPENLTLSLKTFKQAKPVGLKTRDNEYKRRRCLQYKAKASSAVGSK